MNLRLSLTYKNRLLLFSIYSLFFLQELNLILDWNGYNLPFNYQELLIN